MNGIEGLRGRWIGRLGLWALLTAGAIVGAASRGDTPASASPDAGSVDGCGSEAIEVDGRRRLALIVGVGKYKGSGIHQLAGPPNDAAQMESLLTEQYGFPKQNVCVLSDEQATTSAFKNAFDRALVGRSRIGKDDIAVLYFAGHGSQTPDINGDEDDGWDETLLFHDARTGGVSDLVDDELNALLARLYTRTHNMVLILDSCNSGTADRGPEASTFRVRFVDPPVGAGAQPLRGPTGGLRDPWVPAEMKEAVVFSAAVDGTSALETAGRGVFTTGLVEVLGKVGANPLSYAQAARRVPVLVAAMSSQIPSFEGKLDREVFGSASRPRPLVWEVKKAGPVVELSGPPTAGMGAGAELRLYSPSKHPADYSDPGKAKATLVVEESRGLNATAHVGAAPAAAAPPQEGDFAILVRPSDEAIRISVRLRPGGEAGGLPPARAKALRDAVAKDPDARVSVVLTEGPADFELSVPAGGGLQLRGPENNVRNVFSSDGAVPRALWLHARQKALRFLQAEGGGDFDDETLQVRIKPAANQAPCGQARLGEWVQSAPGADQVVPLCVRWNIEVRLSERSPVPLRVGGVILSSDGSTTGFPHGPAVTLNPGAMHTFRETFLGAPPLDTQDFVRVFGTQQSNPVAWDLLTLDVATRGGPTAPRTALHRALDRYLTPGARGAPEVDPGPVEDTTWAAGGIAARVEANLRFKEPAAGAKAPLETREYTLPHFDIRPYLPDDPDTALYRVLQKADELARTQVGYKQHPWREASDAANLARGIDCSRAIWYVFTRSGLPYNKKNSYLTTADMSSPNSAMKDSFARCDGAYREGDVIVYRDASRGDGHVVMVVDPVKRIAWGSHGWDGNAGELKIEPQTGIEFQRIKHKPDWIRWDRPGMQLKECWRFRQFAEEAGTGRGQAGTRALMERTCETGRCLVDNPLKAPGR